MVMVIQMMSFRNINPKFGLFFFFQPTDESDIVATEEAVDTFTLLHHDLNICTNFVSNYLNLFYSVVERGNIIHVIIIYTCLCIISQVVFSYFQPQYQMILDIVNNLLLHVEQKQKVIIIN